MNPSRCHLRRSDVQLLESKFPGDVLADVDLSLCSRWRVGGKATCIVSPSDQASLKRCLLLCQQNQIRYIVLGSTSNVLFSDEGLNVLCISLAKLKNLQFHGDRVCAEMGVWVPNFARKLASQGLSGLEHIVGIPGSLGGVVFMNGGSLRRSIGDNIEWVKTLDHRGKERKYDRSECGFSYRTSAFQGKDEILVQAEFRLTSAPQASIRSEMLGILRSRRKKFPLNYPNCGSVFISDPKMYHEIGPPGAVIEKCGLKGVKIGGAQVSPDHANFIINLGGAKSSEIIGLIEMVRSTVRSQTGYVLKPEVRHVAADGRIRNIENLLSA